MLPNLTQLKTRKNVTVAHDEPPTINEMNIEERIQRHLENQILINKQGNGSLKLLERQLPLAATSRQYQSSINLTQQPQHSNSQTYFTSIERRQQHIILEESSEEMMPSLNLTAGSTEIGGQVQIFNTKTPSMLFSTAKKTGFGKLNQKPQPIVQNGVLDDVEYSDEYQEDQFEKLDYHNGQNKAKYISNIKGKLHSIQKLINPNIIDLDDHYDNLTGTQKYLKRQINSIKKRNMKFQTLQQNNSQESLNQHDNNLSIVDNSFAKESSLPQITNISQLSQNNQNNEQIKTMNGSRSQSVSNIKYQPSQKSKEQLSLEKKKKSVIKYVKTVNQKSISEMFNQNKQDEYNSNQYYHLFQNPILAKIDNENRSKSVINTGRIEMTYQNPETIKNTFPVRKIEYRQPTTEDAQAKQLFEQKLKQIINDSQDYRSYKYNQGKQGGKQFIEKEIILRCKLYKIDSLMSGFFQESSDSLQLGTKVVKLTDVAKYPRKNSPEGKLIMEKLKNGQKLEQTPKFSLQIGCNKADPLGTGKSKEFKQFIKGVSLTDHQGVLLSATGTKFDTAGYAAIPEAEYNKVLKQRKQYLLTEDNEKSLSPSKTNDDESSTSPQNKLKKYFRRKHEQEDKLNEQKQRQRELSQDSNDDHHVGLLLQKINQLHLDMKQNGLGKIGQDGIKELPKEIQDMIDYAMRESKIRDQKEYSKSLKRKLTRYNRNLREELGLVQKLPLVNGCQNNSCNSSDSLETNDYQEVDSIYQTRETLSNKQDTYQDIKNRTLKSIEFKEGMKKTYTRNGGDAEDSMSISDTTYTQTGSNVNSTYYDFKQNMSNMKKDLNKRVKKNNNGDLMERLLEEQLREELKNAQLIKKRNDRSNVRFKREMTDRSKSRNNENENMNVIQDEFDDILKINGKNYNKHRKQTLTQKQVQAIKSDNILKILQSQIQDKNKKHFILNSIIKDIKEKNHHQKGIKEAMGRYLQLQEEQLQTGNKNDSIPYEQSESQTFDDASEALSTINKKVAKKTDRQKKAETEALQCFIMECEKRKILTKEILKNLKDKKLTFVNSTIDQGLKMALKTFIGKGIKDGAAFDSIIFSHNNFTDEQLGELLEPLSEPKSKLKSLISIKNPIGPKALQSLLKLIKPEKIIHEGIDIYKNKNLQELILNDSKLLQQEMMAKVINSLTICCTGTLKILGLANQTFDENSCQELITFVGSSSILKKLDISFANVTSFKYFIDIIDSLATDNKSIQFLNIGGNSYLGSKRDPSSMETRLRYVESLVQLIQESQTLIHLNLINCFPGIQILEDGFRPTVIKKYEIQDRDTGQKKEEFRPYDEVQNLFIAISKSKSLQSVHYSSNSIDIRTLRLIKIILKIEDGNGYKTGGITQNDDVDVMGALNDNIDMEGIKNAIGQRFEQNAAKADDLKAVKYLMGIKKQPQNNQNTKSIPNVSPNQQNNSMINFKNKLSQITPNNKNQQKQVSKEKTPKGKVKHKMDLRTDLQIVHDKSLVEKERISVEQCFAEKNVPQNDRFIFQRILGHQEIQNGYKWCFRDVCWMCQQWVYSLFIWSPSLANSGDLFSLQDTHWLTRWEDKVMKQNQLTQYQSIYNMDYHQDLPERWPHHPDVHNCPRIIGPGTNFKFKKMTPVYQFLEKIMENNRQWLRIYEGDGETKRIKQYKEQQHTEEIAENALVNCNKDWPYVLKNYLKFGHKQINLSLSKLNKYGVDLQETYYVYADLYPPHPQNIVLAVQSRQEQQISLISQRFMTRNCDAQCMLKSIKKLRLERSFNLQNSLFSSWKGDMKSHYKKCFTADMQYSKIHKFVKDPVEYKAVCDVLLDNFEMIFEQYVHGQGCSNYPSVSMVDFTNICNVWNIVNRKDLSISDIDRLFFAVNFEEVGGSAGDLEDNPDKELCRYEFFEIIVRMAKLKYENQKLNLTVAQATQKLLQDYVSNVATQQQWHGLRRKQIWNLEVHDVLEANQDNIKLFVNWCITNFSLKQGRKILNLSDVQNLFTQIPKGCEGTLKQECRLLENNIILAFANSKFLITDEMTHAHNLITIKLDEFYELICRIAQQAQFTGSSGWSSPPKEKEENENELQEIPEEGGEQENDEDKTKKEQVMEPMGQQMLMQDKVYKVIDLLMKICKDPNLNLKAKKPTVLGLGDSESDYDSS